MPSSTPNTPAEKAEQGLLQYAYAWGGTITTYSLFQNACTNDIQPTLSPQP